MKLNTGINPTLAILFVGMTLSTALSAQTTLEQLRSKFDNEQVFISEFQHSYLDSYTQESTNSIGEFWINFDNYKLTGEQQTIVVDGKLSRVYDANRNRVIISDYEPDDDDFGVLSRMLSGEDDSYTSTESELDNGHTLISLVTDDDFATYLSVEIEVDENLQPLKITAYDIADNIIITTFENGVFMQADSSFFEFTHPEDAEIVDMRY